jgi:FAD/FMN-containing dehydrogenase
MDARTLPTNRLDAGLAAMQAGPGMHEVAALYDFNGNAQRRFAERIKDVLDPNGILSPGDQGIWPASHRNED